MVQALRAKKSSLTKAAIDQLARSEIMIPMKHASDELRASIGADRNAQFSHSKLFKALFWDPLLASPVGKTIHAMRSSVMNQYGIQGPTVEDISTVEENQPGYKRRQMLNMQDEAKACADVLLGMPVPALSASLLPPELVDCWKSLDQALCEWASDNAGLGASDIKQARNNLAVDLIVTRLVMPLVMGPSGQSNLVVPQLFCSAVKQAILDQWPAFFDDFLVIVARERTASGAPSTSKTTTTSATATTVTTTLTTAIASPQTITTTAATATSSTTITTPITTPVAMTDPASSAQRSSSSDAAPGTASTRLGDATDEKD